MAYALFERINIFADTNNQPGRKQKCIGGAVYILVQGHSSLIHLYSKMKVPILFFIFGLHWRV